MKVSPEVILIPSILILSTFLFFSFRDLLKGFGELDEDEEKKLKKT